MVQELIDDPKFDLVWQLVQKLNILCGLYTLVSIVLPLELEEVDQISLDPKRDLLVVVKSLENLYKLV